MPALAAGMSGTTSSTLGEVILRPNSMNITLNTAIANKKLAIGPAATTAARCHKGLRWKAPAFSCSVISGAAAPVGALATF